MKKSRLIKIFSLLIAVVVIASVFTFAFEGVSVANALTWGDKDSATLWQYANGALDIASAKQVVATWDLSKVNEPIVIGVIDTGISTTHPLFANTLLKDGEIVVGYNVPKDSTAQNDLRDTSSYHGTGVAGAIAMLIEEFNLSKYIKIYPIKANTGDKDSFNIVNLTKAIDNAREMGVDVINMSLGFTETLYKQNTEKDRNAFEYALESAREKSVIVAAAGNIADNSDPYNALYYPAAFDNTLSVMGYGKDLKIYKSSHYGAMYDVVAPGEDIYTATGVSGYDQVDGTSMAASSVSFACALLKLRHLQEGNGELTSNEISHRIRNLNGLNIQKGGVNYKGLTLNALVTQDFDNTIYDYTNPTAISIAHNGALGSGEYKDKIVARASDKQAISLVAKLSPLGKVDPDLGNIIEWTLTRIDNWDSQNKLESSLIGRGEKIDFTPARGGDFILSAELKAFNLKAEIYLHVEYSQYYVGEVRVTLSSEAHKGVDNSPSSGKMYSKEECEFALTGVEFVNPDVEIKWFVNGEHVASGRTFKFAPTKAGKYEITAQYGDNKMVDFDYKFTMDVRSFITRPLDLSLLIVGIAIGSALIVTLGVMLAKRKGKKEVDSNSNDNE